MRDGKDPVISDGQVFEAGTQALFAAVGEGAKIVVPAVAASAGWQAMLAVTLPLMSLAVAKGAYRILTPRTALLAKGYGHAFGDDPKKVEDHAKQREQDPNYHETMYRTFRSMMDAAEQEVVETIGYMAGVYTLGGRRPDAFFRGLGRLLCDCEQGELDRFRSLMLSVRAAQAPDAKWVSVQFEPRKVHAPSDDDPRDPNLWRTLVTIGVGGGKVDLGRHPEAERLFLLLKREGLAGTPSALGPDDHEWDTGPEGDNALEMPMDTLDRALAILDPRL